MIPLLPASEVRSVLIVRLSSLGDILLMTPALRCLRTAYPLVRVDVLIKEQYTELLESNPYITNLIPLPDPVDRQTLDEFIAEHRITYDNLVDLHTSIRSVYLRKRLKVDRTLQYHKKRLPRWLLVHLKRNVYGGEFSIPLAYIDALQPLGVEDDGGGLEWPHAWSQQYTFLRQADLQQPPEEKPVALCPGASYATKRWPVDRWVELARLLSNRGFQLWIFGDNSDQEAGAEIAAVDPHSRNFCGSLSLAEAGAGLSLCRLAVTHDAGPAHMAAAVGIPVVALFGSTVPQFGFKPFRVPHRIAETQVSCRPCSHLGFDHCPKEHFRCLKELSPGQVWDLVDDLLSETEEG